jgi:hypothetical protein
MLSSTFTYADRVTAVKFRTPSIYGQNYAAGFDRGYAAAWNAYRTGDALERWVRDWSQWVITNPAYVRGYQEGVKQAQLDAQYIAEEGFYEDDKLP